MADDGHVIGRGDNATRPGLYSARGILALCFAWLVAVLLGAPFLGYVFGAGANLLVGGFVPWKLLQISFLLAVLVMSAGVFLLRRDLVRFLLRRGPDRWQVLIVVAFVVVLVIPRLSTLSQQCPISVYDDIWHFQKIVSVFGSFPDFKHYYFPDLKFSYYFYGYMVPAVLYTSVLGLNLKVVWLVYISVVSFTMSLTILTFLNPFLPRQKFSRVVLVLCITFVGGLHEWPDFVTKLLAGNSNLHTEWWAMRMGLQMQVSSFYTINFWACQHLMGLALFAMTVFFLNRTRWTGKWYLCGALCGLAMGFSVYTALFTIGYVAVYLCFMLWAGNRQVIRAGVSFSIPFLVTFLPLLPFYVGRDQTVFVTDDWQVYKYPLFLLAEFGIAAICFGWYSLEAFRTKALTRKTIGKRTTVVFVLGCLAVLFVLRSEGFNVLFFRGIMPAQLLVYPAAIVAAYELIARKRWFLYVVIVFLAIQLTAFLPELLAMSKMGRMVKQKFPPLPQHVVDTNMNVPFDKTISIPYKPTDKKLQFRRALQGLFRMKNVSVEYLFDESLDPNNLVYLNGEDKDKLHRLNKQQQ